MLKVTLVLVEHLPVHGREAVGRLTLQDHLVEVFGGLLFEDDAHVAPRFADHTTTTTSLDIW